MAEDRFLGVREFVAVAQLRSFSAAAAASGVTGSALSKSVMRLEARLGVKLLHRTTRRVSLTNEGALYLESCQRALTELDETEAYLGTGQTEPIGRVRIDLPAAFGRRHVVPSLIALSMRHAKLDLSVTFSERTVDVIKDGIDLVVRIGALQDDAELIARRLGEQRLVICAAPGYLAVRGTPKVTEDLAAHDCLIAWRRGQRHQWLLKDAKGRVQRVDVPVRHEMGDGEAMVEATLAGCGLCQLPTWLIAEHLRSGALCSVLPEAAGGEMPIHAIWPRSQYLPSKLRVVIDELVRIAAEPSGGFRD